MKTFSKEWTDQERIKIVLLIVDQIQTDIPTGRYGAPLEVNDQGVPIKFRPNMQSIVEVLMAPAAMLEAERASLEDLIWETAQAHGETDREKVTTEFFAVSLEEARGRVFGFANEFDPEIIAETSERFRKGVERARAVLSEFAPVPPPRERAELCQYQVQAKDDLVELCMEASTSTEGTDALLKEVKRLNRAEKIEDFWKPGRKVFLPKAVCLVLVERDKKKEMH